MLCFNSYLLCLEVNIFPEFSMFHVEGLKSPAKSAEVCCFLLSLVDCHKELSLPLVQMNETYLCCIHRGIVEKYIDLNNFSSICYCSVKKISYKWLQATSPFYPMCHSAVANECGQNVG